MIDPTQQDARAEPGTALQIVTRERMEMQNVMAWGRLMDASGFFPDTQSAAQAAVKILAGRELGFSTIASMTGIFILDGKPVLGSGLMAQALKKSKRYDYRVREHTEEVCTIEVFERNDGGEWESIGLSTFTKDDAVRAELGRRSTRNPNVPSVWEKYPRNLLFARAMSNAIAFYAPDVFETRVYTAEEIRPDLEYNEQGDPLDIASVQARPKAMERDPDDPAPARTAAGSPPRFQAAPSEPQGAPRQRPAPPPRNEGPVEIRTIQDVTKYAFQRWQEQPARVCEVLGITHIREWRGTPQDAWARVLAAHTDPAAPPPADTGLYPWLPEFEAALANWGITIDTVLLAHDEPVGDGEPYESLIQRVGAILQATGMSAALYVEEAAAINEDEALHAERLAADAEGGPDDAEATTEPAPGGE